MLWAASWCAQEGARGLSDSVEELAKGDAGELAVHAIVGASGSQHTDSMKELVFS